MKETNVGLRIAKDRLFFVGVVLLSFAVLAPLLLILLYIIRNGIAVVDWRFLVNLPGG